MHNNDILKHGLVMCVQHLYIEGRYLCQTITIRFHQLASTLPNYKIKPIVPKLVIKGPQVKRKEKTETKRTFWVKR